MTSSARDKILCGLLYTGIFIPFVNWAPLVWIILINIGKVRAGDFVRYHCYQALIFNMVAFFLPQLFSLVVGLFADILSLLVVFENSANLLRGFSSWLISNYFIFIQIVAIYGVIWTMRGKYTYMPPVSQAANMLLR